MRILYVTPEVFPLIKTGGLADVAGALPKALRRAGMDVRLLVPGYPAVLAAAKPARALATIADLPDGQTGRLLLATAPGDVPLYILDAPALYDRPGTPYWDPSGKDWVDNDVRFAALSWTAVTMAEPGLAEGWTPEILHCQDWQTGLAPAYAALRGGARPATILTIHNIAYQGFFPAHRLATLKLPPESFSMHGVEHHGQVGFLKAGLYYADRISTVSPTYAREIQGPTEGRGLQGLLLARSTDLWGILNGVDYEVWNPAADTLIEARYDADSLDRKSANRHALEEAFGLRHDESAPVFGCVARLTYDKGFDLLAAALPHLVALGGRLVLLGSGEPGLQDAFRDAAQHNPQAVGVRIGFDEALAHRIQAGSDVLLVPSRSEPCGLTQLYAMRYGTLPLVQAVGGLADTVVDASDASIEAGAAAGFVLPEPTMQGMQAALDRAAALFKDASRWRRIQRHDMSLDFSWSSAAQRYVELYRSAASSRASAA
jgi:starch synthase